MNEFIRKEIKELAEIILEQSQKLLAYEQGAPQIEVDIIKENIRKLYDNLDKVVNEKWQVRNIPKETITEEAIDEQVDELINIAEAQFEENIEKINQQIVEQEDIIEEQNEVVEEEIEILEHPREEEIKKEVEAIKPIQEDVSVEESIIEEKPVLEEKKEEVVEEDVKTAVEPEKPIVSAHIQKKPIKNLNTAIGINDKFQFINELFDGSMKIYNKAIGQIEDAANRKEAMDLLNSIATDGNWDIESAAYLQLFDYVDRRFL
jgi:hypothetical protein